MGFLRTALGSGWPGQQQRALKRDVQPLEGTLMSLYNSQIPDWWSANVTSTTLLGTPQLAERVWVANRCQQLNAQQIASMPLRWHGPDGVIEPAWVSSPDPNLFPNGVCDALFAIVDQVYGWGFSCQYVTDTYASGFPRTWTVLPSAAMNIRFEDGSRQYKLGDTVLDSRRVVQIDRDPSTAAHGTSALRAYAQRSWMAKTSARNGGVPVLGQGWTFENSGINPSDMALLETQEWDARVICTAYGVPSVMLNMALQGGLTYQNPLALMQMWWLTEL